MFLLIHVTEMVNINNPIIFTFHNVSINTGIGRLAETVNISLHSTMFLLIPQCVSVLLPLMVSLHSTMFLLILNGRGCFYKEEILYIPQCFY